MILCRCLYSVRTGPCWNAGREASAEKAFVHSVRLSYWYFTDHQCNTYIAIFVLLLYTLLSIVISALDRLCLNVHTWWMLNNELRKTPSTEHYMHRPVSGLAESGKVEVMMD